MSFSDSQDNSAAGADGAYADGFERGAPSGAGVDADAIEAFLDDAEAAGLDLHSFMAHRAGKLVAEAWWWPYQPRRPRIMHSVAKSFTACAIGLAVQEGHLRLDDKVASFFPKDVPADASESLKAMTIEHLLTMRAGHAEEVSGSEWRGVSSSWVREFFKIPVVHKPGEVHVYSSAASYMLSAILTRATGETLHDFLKPRLFAPLGIVGERWDVGPDGFNPGGNGLSCTSADLLKLGVLHAQGGMWRGRRLLPETWIEAAARRRGPEDYGYHWGLNWGGAYSARGLFGQLMMVFPNEGAAIVVTGAIQGSAEINRILQKHFPRAFRAAPFENQAGDERLRRRLLAYAARPPREASASPRAGAVSGLAYAAQPNAQGVREVGFRFEQGRCVYRQLDAAGEHAVTCGVGDWIEGRTGIPGRALHHGYEMPDAPVVARARWLDDATLEMNWVFIESAFRDTVVCTFKADGVIVSRRVNVNSGALRLPDIIAEARR